MGRRKSKKQPFLIALVVLLLGFLAWVTFVPTAPSVVLVAHLSNPTDSEWQVVARLAGAAKPQTVTIGPSETREVFVAKGESTSALRGHVIEFAMVDNAGKEIAFWQGLTDELLSDHFDLFVPHPVAVSILNGELNAVRGYFAQHKPNNALHYAGAEWRPIRLAVDGKQPEVIEYLLSIGADPCMKGRFTGTSPSIAALDSALNSAFKNLQIAELRLLMQSPFAQACICSRDGADIVVINPDNAAAYEVRDVIASAVSDSACVTEVDRLLVVGACIGTFNDGPAMLEWIGSVNPGVYERFADSPKSPYFGVLSFGDIPVDQAEQMFDLLHGFGVPHDVENVTVFNGSLLIGACSVDTHERSNESLLKRLLDWGSDVNAKDDEGFTPLIEALSNEHLSDAFCMRLIEMGAHINDVTTRMKVTPLSAALTAGRLGVAKVLIERGARLANEEVVPGEPRDEVIRLINQNPGEIDETDTLIKMVSGN